MARWISAAKPGYTMEWTLRAHHIYCEALKWEQSDTISPSILSVVNQIGASKFRCQLWNESNAVVIHRTMHWSVIMSNSKSESTIPVDSNVTERILRENTYESGAQTWTLKRLAETRTRTRAWRPGASMPSSLVTMIVGRSAELESKRSILPAETRGAGMARFHEEVVEGIYVSSCESPFPHFYIDGSIGEQIS